MQALKSRTIQFALLLAIFGVIEANLQFFAQYMTSQVFGYFAMAVGLVVAVLRVITTVPLSEK